jgi:hypothetical protein
VFVGTVVEATVDAAVGGRIVGVDVAGIIDEAGGKVAVALISVGIAVDSNGVFVSGMDVPVGGINVLVTKGTATTVAEATGIRPCAVTGEVISLTLLGIAVTFTVAVGMDASAITVRAVRVPAAFLPAGERPYTANPPTQRQRSKTTPPAALPITSRRLLREFCGTTVVGGGAVGSSGRLMLHPPFTTCCPTLDETYTPTPLPRVDAPETSGKPHARVTCPEWECRVPAVPNPRSLVSI